jgi:ketosteroid isomerase-like protein
MKKLLMISPLVFLLCFAFSCQQAEEVAKEGLTEEEVNAILAEVVKVYNNADMEACDKVYSADLVYYDPLAGGEIVGIDAFKEMIRALHKERTIVNISIDETFIKGDKFAILCTVKETLLNGVEIESSAMVIVRIVDGKIAKATAYYDTKSVLEQMGFKIVPPEEPEEK